MKISEALDRVRQLACKADKEAVEGGCAGCSLAAQAVDLLAQVVEAQHYGFQELSEDEEAHPPECLCDKCVKIERRKK